MLKEISRHLQFLRKSTNQHGVHSPFVYSYLTEGIYATKKSYKGYQKSQRLLQATITYFHIQEIFGNPEFSIDLSKEKPTHPGKGKYPKLHYVKSIKTYTADKIQELIHSINEDTILYIDGPNQSKKENENWQALVNNEKFQVSIDFYVAGILLVRKEQRKEHFTLRV